jgi:hypothetical protein
LPCAAIELRGKFGARTLFRRLTRRGKHKRGIITAFAFYLLIFHPYTLRMASFGQLFARCAGHCAGRNPFAAALLKQLRGAP